MGSSSSSNNKNKPIEKPERVPEPENKHYLSPVPEEESVIEDKFSSFTESIKCRKHISHDVTHICENTEELLCHSCSTRLSNVTEYQNSCVDIETYTNSFKFKQIEARTAEQLRTRKTFLVEELKFIDYHESKALSKHDEMIEEVETFAGRLVELIRHMEHELCQNVNTTMNEYVNNLRHRREYIKTWQEELQTIQDNFNRNESENKNTALHLRSVLDCKSFVTSVKSNVHQMRESTDYKLKLNKLLTLKDIVGGKESTGNISLGEVFCDNKENARSDILSVASDKDLSQDLSDTEEDMETPTADNNNDEKGLSNSYHEESGTNRNDDITDTRSNKCDSDIKSISSDKDRAVSTLKDDKDKAVSDAKEAKEEFDSGVRSAFSDKERASSNIKDEKDQAARDVKSALSHKERAISDMKDERDNAVRDAKSVISNKDREISSIRDDKDRAVRDVKSVISNKDREISNIRDDKDQAIRDMKSVISNKDREMSNIRDDKDQAVRDVKSVFSDKERAISSIKADKDQAVRDVNSVLSGKERAISEIKDDKLNHVKDVAKTVNEEEKEVLDRVNAKMRNQFGREFGLAEKFQRTSSPAKSQARPLSTPKLSRNSFFSPMW